MTKHTLRPLSIACLVAITACGGGDNGTTPVNNQPVNVNCNRVMGKTLATTAQGFGVPQTGRLLAIGQDIDSIGNYVNAMGAKQTPGGVVGYVDMELNGLNSSQDAGAGRNNLTELANNYPNSAVIVAVHAVGKLDAINNGNYNNNITTLISTLKSYNRPVYLRFGYEFDGTWNAYEPNAYKAAFWRIKYEINRQGANGQINMVWQSSSYCDGGQIVTYQGRDPSAWYPGVDGQPSPVDLVAVSFFTPTAIGNRQGGTCNNNHEAIDRIANFAKARNLPLMIAESTPQGYTTEARTWHSTNAADGNNASGVSDQQLIAWYDDYFNWIEANNVKVVTYINANWNSQPMWASGDSGYWGDSRVEANAAVKNFWIQKTTPYLKASANLFSALGFNQGNGGSITGGGTSSNNPTSNPYWHGQ